MEVHHHSNHGKKNWKSYLWDFIMLFLAVFCGFLAEYQLEHIIEHKKEKQYIESMIEDIKEDTAKINSKISYDSLLLNGIDRLQKNIYHTPYTDSSLKIMYFLQRDYIHRRSLGVSFTKRTIIQLKNAGGLRLIRNMAVSDSIVLFDEAIAHIESLNDIQLDAITKAKDFSAQIFDAEYIYEYNRENLRGFLHTEITVKLLNNDEKLIREYANWISFIRNPLNTYIGSIKNQKDRSVRMIQFLRKEYHL